MCSMFNPEIFEQSIIGMVIYTQKIWDFILSADFQYVTYSLKQIFLLTQYQINFFHSDFMNTFVMQSTRCIYPSIAARKVY